MVNNTTNIKKTNTYLSPQFVDHKLDIWQWKSRSWLGTATKMWQGSICYWNFNPPDIDDMNILGLLLTSPQKHRWEILRFRHSACRFVFIYNIFIAVIKNQCKCSKIYENSILGVNVFLLTRNYDQKLYYKYSQIDPTEKCKHHQIGPKDCHHSKKGGRRNRMVVGFTTTCAISAYHQ